MPNVRFFQSRRGSRMVYADEGSGPPLVFPAWWASHLGLDVQDPGFCTFAGFDAQFRLVATTASAWD